MITKFLQGAGNLLDLPGSMARDALALQNPFDQLATPFSDQNRISGRGLLRNYGLAGSQDTWGNFAGGLAVEAATDPLNFIGGGFLGKYAKNVGKVKAANKVIGAENALSQSQRAMGFMPEEIAKQTKIVDPQTGMPKRMYHGTAAVFDKYDMNKASEGSLYGKGIYTTDSPRVGSSYAKKRDDMPDEYYFGDEKSVLDYARNFAAAEKDNLEKIIESRPNSQFNRTRIADLEKINQFLGLDDGSASKHLFDTINGIARGFGKSAHSDFENHLFSRMVAHPDVIAHSPYTTPNVRMQYMDIRNPLDIEKTYKGGELGSPARRYQRDNVRMRVKNLRQHREMVNRYKEKIQIPNSWNKTEMDEIRNIRSGFANRNNIPDMTGQEIYDMAGGELGLRSLGYDGITHLGGQRIGGLGDHNVAIAWDPSQAYLPYIAKALQDYKPIPKAPRKTLKAITTHNVAARTSGKNDNR